MPIVPMYTNLVLLASWFRAYRRLITKTILHDKAAHAHALATVAETTADTFDTHKLFSTTRLPMPPAPSATLCL